MWLPIRRFIRKLLFPLERERFQRELTEELAAHQAFKLEEHTRAGLTLPEAMQRTQRDMGNVTLAAEQSTDVRSLVSWEQLMQDIRYAFRLLRTNLGFSLVAILSLAVGIGGSTAVFSMLNALLIKPLPFGEPQQLVRITEFFPKAILVHLRQRCRSVEIASASPGLDLNLTGQGPAFRVTASPVSANLFSVLRVPSYMGRTFEPHEDQPGRDDVVILSYELWTQRFGSSPDIVGRMITINGVTRRIVGVMPAGFAFPSARVQIWIPAAIDPRQQVDYWAGEFTPLIGRLRPGATLQQAASEIRPLVADVWRMFPWPMPQHWNANATVIPLQTDLAGDASRRLLMLLCTVGAVLVIACANVAGLLTARGAARSKELALRTALGAGQSRIVRQLLTESIVLAAAAGVCGLMIAGFASRLLTAVLPADLPAAASASIDWNVAAFASALSLLAGISFGIAPAFSASRISVLEAVKTGGQRSATAASIQFRSCLIAGEIALTLVLVVGAALLLRSLYTLSHVDPGFQPQQVLTLKISPDASFCKDPAACVAFYERVLAQSRGVRGVVDVALANTVPLDGAAPSLPVDVEDHPKTADFPAPMLWTGAITPEYLRLMRIPLLSGRSFTTADTSKSEPVLLIDAATARRFWPGQNAIGKHIKWAGESHWRTVVGVVADVRQFNLANRPPSGISGALYMPYAQAVDSEGRIPLVMNLIVRTGSLAPETAHELHRFVAAVNPNIPVSRVLSLDSRLDESLSSFRSTAWLFLSFAFIALALATIGIYGLVSFSVRQRTYEIALRMAIGATGGSILRMVLVRSIQVTLSGLAIGMIGALLVARGLSAALSEVTTADPLIFLAVSAFLLAVTIVASVIPARQALSIDPVRVLRSE